MNGTFLANYGIFLIMQILAQMAMRGGSGGRPLKSRRWWYGFVLANAVGAPSILFLKELYKSMPATPNVVHALQLAGTFSLTQLVFVVFFRSRLQPFQWAGIGVLAIGALLVVVGKA